MKKVNLAILIGVILFSLMMGIVLGLSSSPVAGVFVSAAGGVIVLVIGYFKLGEKESPVVPDVKLYSAGNHPNGTAFGILLSCFSVFVLAGILIGSGYRKNKTLIKPIIVWTKENAPKSTYEALDWVYITQLLQHRGYSNSQIHEIYNIRLLERTNPEFKDDEYDNEMPYFRLLSPSKNETENIRTNSAIENVKMPVFY